MPRAASSSASTKRPRLRASCAACRKRKIACTGERDGCVACRSRSDNCVYETQSQMGRPRKSVDHGDTVSRCSSKPGSRKSSPSGDQREDSSSASVTPRPSDLSSGGVDFSLPTTFFPDADSPQPASMPHFDPHTFPAFAASYPWANTDCSQPTSQPLPAGLVDDVFSQASQLPFWMSEQPSSSGASSPTSASASSGSELVVSFSPFTTSQAIDLSALASAWAGVESASSPSTSSLPPTPTMSASDADFAHLCAVSTAMQPIASTPNAFASLTAKQASTWTTPAFDAFCSALTGSAPAPVDFNSSSSPFDALNLLAATAASAVASTPTIDTQSTGSNDDALAILFAQAPSGSPFIVDCSHAADGPAAGFGSPRQAFSECSTNSDASTKHSSNTPGFDFNFGASMGMPGPSHVGFPSLPLPTTSSSTSAMSIGSLTAPPMYPSASAAAAAGYTRSPTGPMPATCSVRPNGLPTPPASEFGLLHFQ